MENLRSVNSATYNPLDFLPEYYTTAVPTDLSPERLDEIGFRRQHEIKFHLTSLNYTNCRAFHKEYILKWWELLGLCRENVKECSAKHFPGTRGDLCLTYRLIEPVHLAKISNFPRFKFIAPGAIYCEVHDQRVGQLAVDPPTDDVPASIVRPTYCCSRLETQSFECTIMGRDDLYFRI